MKYIFHHQRKLKKDNGSASRWGGVTMDSVSVIDILKRVFTYGDATATHIDIVKYLDGIHIKKATYEKWGKNAGTHKEV